MGHFTTLEKHMRVILITTMRIKCSGKHCVSVKYLDIHKHAHQRMYNAMCCGEHVVHDGARWQCELFRAKLGP